MKADWISIIRGYIKVEARGKQLEALINEAVERKFGIWGIRRTGEQTISFYIAIPHFFRLRPLLKRTGCRVHVQERFGFPFWLVKLGRRKFFVLGVASFIVGVFLLSSLVWDIEVEGNEKLKSVDIIQAAREQGIYPLQWTFRLRNSEQLSKTLQNKLPGTSWVGVEIHGTKVRIKVVESKAPDKKPLQGPRNLIASADAVVTSIYAEKGKPLVKTNARVRKGDVLISGIIGGDGNMQAVIAQGTVRGLVWHEYSVEAPLVHRTKTYTGEDRVKKYVAIGGWKVQIYGFGKAPYEKSETFETTHTLHWRNYSLPIGWTDKKTMEVRMEERTITAEQAKETGLQQARADLMARPEAAPKLVSEKILQENTDNGKVYMKVLFEVEENIAKEQLIVP